ncbi:MAG TPA: hypothetical protein VKX96_06095 [Chloroflexota bacterium]|nr:hypothetical protein [Chloroflexota bacterium]
MAQMQPMTSGKLEPVSNVTYDLVTVLSNVGEAVDALDTYIEDAKKANDRDAQQVFEQIRADEMRHGELLRNTICNQIKQGKF